MVRVKAPLTRQQGTSQSSCGHPAVEKCPGGARHGEQSGRGSMIHTQDTDRRLKRPSTHLYHWRSFTMLSLKGNICLPTKNYNLKNGIWYNYNL